MATSWKIPAICTPGELADWLGISLGDLDWFADLRGLEFKRNHLRLRNYHYRPLVKRSGQPRLIEAPKPRLKEVQRRILAGILARCAVAPGRAWFLPWPVDHDVCFGTHWQTSCPAPRSARLLLSISAAHVQAVFRTIGYAEPVADLLAGVCTNRSPSDVWEDGRDGPVDRQTLDLRRRYAQPHLPQGRDVAGAGESLRVSHGLPTGWPGALVRSYTRYADDLAFSGDRDFERCVAIHLHASAIAMEEGFAVHHRKTRIMRHGARQHLAGLVVNAHLNVRRGLRSAKGHADQLHSPQTRKPEPGAPQRFPSPPARPDFVCRDGKSSTRPKAARAV